MQKNNFLKFVFLPIAVLALCTAGWYAIAQNIIADDGDGERKVKISMKVTENGQTTETTKEITLEEGQEVEEVLRSMGVFNEMNLGKGNGSMEIRVRSSDEDDWTEDVDFHFAFPHGKHIMKWMACNDSIGDKKAYLGTMLHKAEEDNGGVQLGTVFEDSPAAKAGLKEGDVLISVNGRDVAAASEVTDVLGTLNPGDVIPVKIRRDGSEQEINVTLGEREIQTYGFAFPHMEMLAEKMESVDWEKFGKSLEENLEKINWDEMGKKIEQSMENHDWDKFGKEMEHHMQDFGKMMEMHFDPESPVLGVSGDSDGGRKGMDVDHVWNNSPAEKMGLREGDVIYEVNDRPVRSQGDIMEVLKESKAGDRVKVEYEREGKKVKTEGTLQKRGEVFKSGEPFRHHFSGNSHNRNVKVMIRIEDVTEEDEKKLSEISEKSDLVMNSVSLNPNPADGRFELKFDLPREGNTTIRVYDAHGRRVYDETLHNFKGSYAQTIDISGEPNGFYFLSVEQNGKHFSKKIVKQ